MLAGVALRHRADAAQPRCQAALCLLSAIHELWLIISNILQKLLMPLLLKGMLQWLWKR
jgi:hypothetical protein